MATPTDLKIVISSSDSLPSNFAETMFPSSPYKPSALNTPSATGLIKSPVSSMAASTASTTTLSASAMA